MNRTSPSGFSLLEVIIATAILAASTVMLMSMFATGDRHMTRADERTMAQMLCLSKLEELVADPTQLVAIEADVSPQFPGWVFTVEMQPTSLDGFVQVRVAVTRIPGMPTGANLEVAALSEETSSTISKLPEQPTFELTRWMQYENKLEGIGSQGSTTAVDRLISTGGR